MVHIQKLALSSLPATTSMTTLLISPTDTNTNTNTNEVQRLNTFVSLFESLCGKPPQVVAKAGGRINLIGEHVDYPDLQFTNTEFPSHLMSMGGSIQNSFLTGIRRRRQQSPQQSQSQSEEQNNWLHLYHLNAGESMTCTDFSELEQLEQQAQEERERRVDMSKRCVPEWAYHTLGAVMELSKLVPNPTDVVTTGMDIVLTSNVPHGAGMSNSAANTVSLALAFRHVFGDTVPSSLLSTPQDIVAFARRAENSKFAGGHCGWLDQMLIVFSRPGQLTCIDYVGNQTRHFQSKLPQHYQFVAINTNVPHVLAESEYPDRVRELELGIGLVRKYCQKDYGSLALSLQTYNELIQELNDDSSIGGRLPPVTVDGGAQDPGLVWSKEEQLKFLSFAKSQYTIPESLLRHRAPTTTTVDQSLTILLRRMRHQKASSLIVQQAGKCAEHGDAIGFGTLLSQEGQSLRMSGDFQITGDNGAQDALLDIGLEMGTKLGISLVEGRMLGGGGGGNVIFMVDRSNPHLYNQWIEQTCSAYETWSKQSLRPEGIRATVIEPVISEGAKIVWTAD